MTNHISRIHWLCAVYVLAKRFSGIVFDVLYTKLHGIRKKLEEGCTVIAQCYSSYMLINFVLSKLSCHALRQVSHGRHTEENRNAKGKLLGIQRQIKYALPVGSEEHGKRHTLTCRPVYIEQSPIAVHSSVCPLLHPVEVKIRVRNNPEKSLASVALYECRVKFERLEKNWNG